MARSRAGGRSLIFRIAIALGGIGVVVFAVQGGEWGTFDLFRQQRRLARLQHDVDSLRHEVDSLRRYKTAVETDPALQEKIAREEFGMVRGNRELLYRFTEPAAADTGKGKRRP
jgi:cell division protein FtsB